MNGKGVTPLIYSICGKHGVLAALEQIFSAPNSYAVFEVFLTPSHQNDSMTSEFQLRFGVESLELETAPKMLRTAGRQS